MVGGEARVSDFSFFFFFTKKIQTYFFLGGGGLGEGARVSED